MNILIQKIEDISEIPTYVKNIAKACDWKYVFDIIPYLDRLQTFRGIGKKTASVLELFLKNNFHSVKEVKEKLEKVISDISTFSISSFPSIINSQEFKVLDEFFLELHQKGFSNRTILDSLKTEEIGILFVPGKNGMNTRAFLETFRKAKDKDRDKLMSLLKETKVFFIEAYRNKLLESLEKNIEL
jgi:hypothetical protein